MEEQTTQPIEEKKSGPNMMLIGSVVGVLLLGGAAFALMPKANTETETSSSDVLEAEDVMPIASTATTTETTVASEETIAGVKTFTLEAGSFYYKPNELKVKKGDKVKIIMNSVSMMHDFVIDELNVKMPVTKSGDTGTVEFTADTAGSFTFYCAVGQHRANGQEGTLVVE